MRARAFLQKGVASDFFLFSSVFFCLTPSVSLTPPTLSPPPLLFPVPTDNSRETRTYLAQIYRRKSDLLKTSGRYEGCRGEGGENGSEERYRQFSFGRAFVSTLNHDRRFTPTTRPLLVAPSPRSVSVGAGDNGRASSRKLSRGSLALNEELAGGGGRTAVVRAVVACPRQASDVGRTPLRRRNAPPRSRATAGSLHIQIAAARLAPRSP